MYSLLSINYNKILLYDNISISKQTLHIRNENVIIKNFNLHQLSFFISKAFIFETVFVKKRFVEFYI